MIQMASVFGEQERQIIRSRVLAGLDRVRQQGRSWTPERCDRMPAGTAYEASERWRSASGDRVMGVRRTVLEDDARSTSH